MAGSSSFMPEIKSGAASGSEVPTGALIVTTDCKTATETLVWQINGVSANRAMLHGNYIQSSVYTVGDRKFYMRFYPAGFHKGSQDVRTCNHTQLHEPKRIGRKTIQLTEAEIKENADLSLRKCDSMNGVAASLFLHNASSEMASVVFTVSSNVPLCDGTGGESRVELDKDDGWGHPCFVPFHAAPPGDRLVISVKVTVRVACKTSVASRPRTVRAVNDITAADCLLRGGFQTTMHNKWRSLYKGSSSATSGKETKEQKYVASADHEEPDISSAGQDDPDAVRITSATGRVHYAYRFMLVTHSEVFAAMFAHGTVESKTKHISLEKESNDAAIEAMLEFVHVGEVLTLPENDAAARINLLTDMLKLAHLYELHLLFNWCGDRLGSDVTADSLAEMLILTETYDVADLKTACLEFVAEESKRLEQVCKSDKFAGLSPLTVKDLYDAAYKGQVQVQGRKRKAGPDSKHVQEIQKSDVRGLDKTELYAALSFHKLSVSGSCYQLQQRLMKVLP